MLTASLLRAAPLAIPVAGGDASVLGNDLVDAMCSRPFSSDHPLIMMYWSSMGPRDAVAQLYGSTWPPEERWAEWSRYTVIVAGTEPAELKGGGLFGKVPTSDTDDGPHPGRERSCSRVQQ